MSISSRFVGFASTASTTRTVKGDAKLLVQQRAEQEETELKVVKSTRATTTANTSKVEISEDEAEARKQYEDAVNAHFEAKLEAARRPVVPKPTLPTLPADDSTQPEPIPMPLPRPIPVPAEPTNTAPAATPTNTAPAAADDKKTTKEEAADKAVKEAKDKIAALDARAEQLAQAYADVLATGNDAEIQKATAVYESQMAVLESQGKMAELALKNAETRQVAATEEKVTMKAADLAAKKLTTMYDNILVNGTDAEKNAAKVTYQAQMLQINGLSSAYQMRDDLAAKAEELAQAYSDVLQTGNDAEIQQATNVYEAEMNVLNAQGTILNGQITDAKALIDSINGKQTAADDVTGTAVQVPDIGTTGTAESCTKILEDLNKRMEGPFISPQTVLKYLKQQIDLIKRLQNSDASDDVKKAWMDKANTILNQIEELEKRIATEDPRKLYSTSSSTDTNESTTATSNASDDSVKSKTHGSRHSSRSSKSSRSERLANAAEAREAKKQAEEQEAKVTAEAETTKATILTRVKQEAQKRIQAAITAKARANTSAGLSSDDLDAKKQAQEAEIAAIKATLNTQKSSKGKFSLEM